MQSIAQSSKYLFKGNARKAFALQGNNAKIISESS